MGNCCGNSRNGKIDAQLRLDDSVEKRKIKVLLLGAGESGKTTLFKQMKLLYSDTHDFTPRERLKFRQIIYKNICTDVVMLLRVVRFRGLELTSKEGKTAATYVLKNFKPRKAPEVTKEVKDLYVSIWKDETVQKVWETRDSVQVQDSLLYFMNKIDEIATGNWTPTNQDILRARARTSGAQKTEFVINKALVEMFDVGGQRTERTKWLHYFEEVTTVLFVAAISEYNQVLFEDSSVNRQVEAVELFRAQLKLEAFMNTPFILFLNKKDLFREKLTKVPFKVESGPDKRNASFEGPFIDLGKKYDWEEEGVDGEFETCYTAAIQYLVTLYESQAPEIRGPEGQIYCHPTNSTSSDNIRKIMTSCRDIILRNQLGGEGWFGA